LQARRTQATHNAQQAHSSVGQYSDKGRKERNQDFHGVCIFLQDAALVCKGIAIALADGISSSEVSQAASAGRRQRLSHRLLLHFRSLVGQAPRPSACCGHQRLAACADAARASIASTGPRLRVHLQRLIIKSTTAHLFHVGDSRIYRLRRVERRWSN
jgi:serine/threonine protein phosphatase PrpC